MIKQVKPPNGHFDYWTLRDKAKLKMHLEAQRYRATDDGVKDLIGNTINELRDEVRATGQQDEYNMHLGVLELQEGILDLAKQYAEVCGKYENVKNWVTFLVFSGVLLLVLAGFLFWIRFI